MHATHTIEPTTKTTSTTTAAAARQTTPTNGTHGGQQRLQPRQSSSFRSAVWLEGQTHFPFMPTVEMTCHLTPEIKRVPGYTDTCDFVFQPVMLSGHSHEVHGRQHTSTSPSWCHVLKKKTYVYMSAKCLQWKTLPVLVAGSVQQGQPAEGSIHAILFLPLIPVFCGRVCTSGLSPGIQ